MRKPLTAYRWRYRLVVGHSHAVIVIQRVRVRWGADVRGSQHAKLRSGLPDAFTLPGVEPGIAGVKAGPSATAVSG